MLGVNANCGEPAVKWMYFTEWVKYVWRDERCHLFFLCLSIFSCLGCFSVENFLAFQVLCVLFDMMSFQLSFQLYSLPKIATLSHKRKGRKDIRHWSKMSRSTTALGKSRLEAVCTNRHQFVIVQKFEIFPSVLIPVVDMLQGHLIQILKAILLVACASYPAWWCFWPWPFVQHFDGAFCINQSP